MNPDPTDKGEDVLGTERPRLSASDAEGAAASLFGLAGRASELNSERDQNFLIETADGDRGVLKISNRAEDPAVIDMESGAALHAKRVDSELPIALPWLVGEDGGPDAYRSQLETGDGDVHLVRMFDFMPGESGFDPRRLDHDALRRFGGIVARLGRALRSFFHPAAGRALLWDIQHAARLRPLAERVEDPARRRLLLRRIDRFEHEVEPRMAVLRSQFIHGDISADNTTVDPSGNVTGILDFGDASHTALVVDIASAWASVVWDRRPDQLFPAAAALLDGYQEVTPLEEDELSLLPDLFAARAAAAASISAVRVARDPDNTYIASFDEHAWPLLELFDDLGPEEVSRRLRTKDSPTGVSIDGLLERRQQALGSALLAPTYDRPLHLVGGHGVWMTDAEGRRYLDAYNNVPVLGHSHPRVTESAARQARRLSTNMRYLHEAVIELSERLLATMPADSGLDTVMMVNSGSEANDLAWRLARAWSGGRGGLCSEYAYHGITDAIADLSPEAWRSAAPTHVETFPAPSRRRPQIAAGVKEALARLRDRELTAAATIIDPAFTSDGIHRPAAPDLSEVVSLTREAGALYIADEVQAGYGRTGENLWAFAALGIAPDAVTLGKPMGNGYPVAAVVTRAEIVDRFAGTSEFFSTFGGSPPAAVAALAVLDVIEDEGLIDRAAAVGTLLAAAIEGLRATSPEIADVRSWGLMIGVELQSTGRDGDGAALAERVINRMRELGVLVGVTGAERNVLKVRPPLAFSSDDVEGFAAALAEAIANARSPGAPQ